MIICTVTLTSSINWSRHSWSKACSKMHECIYQVSLCLLSVLEKSSRDVSYSYSKERVLMSGFTHSVISLEYFLSSSSSSPSCWLCRSISLSVCFHISVSMSSFCCPWGQKVKMFLFQKRRKTNHIRGTLKMHHWQHIKFSVNEPLRQLSTLWIASCHKRTQYEHMTLKNLRWQCLSCFQYTITL